MLAWIFSNRTNMSDKELLDLIPLDMERQKNRVGHNILKERILEKYPIEEMLFYESVNIIKDSWKEFYDLINEIKPIVSFQTSDRGQFESESDAKFFGQIIFNMKSKCAVHWAEILVHEIAHHYLNVMLATTPMSSETKNKFKQEKYSHQRNAPRPLIGIFHGVFAQSCMLIYVEKVQRSDLSQEIKSKALKTFERYGEIFSKDLETIIDEGLIEDYTGTKKIILRAQESQKNLRELNLNG
ncbi:MAG: hypothetical protein COW79_13085 [Bdellovibrionales bacterium CG22_combo_CG10-13_8_21_14_all_38_13]|nr:MAG: hypothetical protein COW79_13085 [Bdellovibrionales bacterium CG22_combo_CG10-13_8_21_14_all_38_13]